jgi:hypothetical protein
MSEVISATWPPFALIKRSESCAWRRLAGDSAEWARARRL